MKKMLPAIALSGALMFGLSACAPPTAPTVTVTAEPQAPAPEAPAPEAPIPAPEAPQTEVSEAERAVFFEVMRQRFSEAQLPATESIALDWCATLDSGVSVDEAAANLVRAGEEYGVSANDLGFIVGGGTSVFCPRHSPAMDEFIARNSG